MVFSADDEPTETSVLPGCVHNTNNAHFNRINDYGTLYDEQLTELMYLIVTL